LASKNRAKITPEEQAELVELDSKVGIDGSDEKTRRIFHEIMKTAGGRSKIFIYADLPETIKPRNLETLEWLETAFPGKVSVIPKNLRAKKSGDV
jgi:hypothetical protein